MHLPNSEVYMILVQLNRWKWVDGERVDLGLDEGSWFIKDKATQPAVYQTYEAAERAVSSISRGTRLTIHKFTLAHEGSVAAYEKGYDSNYKYVKTIVNTD